MKHLSPVLLSFVSLAALTVACGGDSKSFNGPTGGSSGTAGSGGSGGKGGSAGKGGSSAGGTAGGSTGGSGGKGGSGTGGSGTGGSDTGGTGGMAGENSGTGGTAAMTGYDPPPEQVDACTRICAEAQLAMCENAETLVQCVEGCRFAIQIEECAAEWDAVFACQDAVEEVTCNADGEPEFPGCGDEYISALDCVYNDALDPALEQPCTDLCEASESVTCDNSAPTADCVTGCQLIGTAIPVCNDQFTAYTECGAMAEEFMCDADGEPQPVGCTGPQLGLLACIVNEYGLPM